MRPFLLSLILLPVLLRAQEFNACRSIHLDYTAPKSDWALIDVTVRDSAPGTYFCALGFHPGYLGMQELGNGKKVIIFSIWDDAPHYDNHTHPDKIAHNVRSKPVAVGDGVEVRRFGGEGTGGQSFYNYDWKIGETIRFAVHSAQDGKSAVYSGYFFNNHRKKWQLMASFRPPKGGPIHSLYSFVEDFRRNGESTRQTRRAEYSNAWVFSNHRWQPVLKAQFTADSNPSLTIDAEPLPHGFALQTGGDTKNTHIKLWDRIKRAAPAAAAPEGLTGLPGIK